MEWGIVMAGPMVLGMLVLIFAEADCRDYQTFGDEVVNPPAAAKSDEQEWRKAA